MDHSYESELCEALTVNECLVAKVKELTDQVERQHRALVRWAERSKRDQESIKRLTSANAYWAQRMLDMKDQVAWMKSELETRDRDLAQIQEHAAALIAKLRGGM